MIDNKRFHLINEKQEKLEKIGELKIKKLVIIYNKNKYV